MSRNQGFIPDRCPTDTARPDYAEAGTALSDATVAGLDRLLTGGDPHALHALLTGAVAALQHLYTVQARVVVGVPARGRRQCRCAGAGDLAGQHAT